MSLTILFLYLISVICNIATAKEDFNDWDVNNNQLCGGCYIIPKYPLALTKNHPPNTLIINANQTRLITKGLSTFNGNVVIAKNNQQLTADQVNVQQDNQGEINSFVAIGNVNLTEPDIRIIGNKAESLQKTNYKVIYDASYRLYNRHARGSASKIEIFDNGITSLPNASYTTCKPNSNTWYLKAKKLVFNKITGRGQAWHTKMYIKDVPIFYWPYLNFPIDDRRQTGFLNPSFNSNSRNGTGVGIPFYWNIAPNYDYTISPFYMSKRGLKIDNRFRYLTNTSSGNLQFNFLPNDLSQNKLNNKTYRHAIWFSNNLNIANNWNLFIKYNKVSDNNYLYDFGQDIGQSTQKITNNISEASLEEVMQNSSLHLEQSAKLENFNKYGFFKLRILQYQTLYPSEGPTAQEQYKKMPEITWNSNYIDLPMQYRTRYNINYVDFKLRDIAQINNDINQKTTGKRIHLRPSLERNFYASYGYIKPKIQLDVLSYQDLQLDNLSKLNNKPNNPSRIIPILDVNTGLNFTKTLPNYIQQTLEPKIYYLYVPKIDQNRYPIFDTSASEFSYDQLFRNNRYNGSDRLAEANQVTFGIKTRFFPENGEEKASIGIARAKYFRGLTSYLGENLEFGRWSPIAMLLNYNLNPQILLEANLVRQKLNQTRSNTFTGQYKLTDQKIINIGYQYVRFTPTPQHLGQISATWLIKPNINLLGKFDYDLHQKHPVYNLFGVELHGCCTILRFAWARNLLPTENLSKKQYDNKFMLQIIFKGLNGIGNLESSYISGKIPGYMPKDGF